MPLLLRRQNAQDLVEGRQPKGWKHDDCAVLDEEKVVGRMYRERLPAGDKWCWFLQVTGASLPNSGIADTLNDAKAAFKERYEAAHHAHTARSHALHARGHADEAVKAHAEEHGKK